MEMPLRKNKLGHVYDKDKNLYLGYVGYTNTKIQELVNTILNNSKGEAVIIIMGDHGFRNDNNMPHHVFLQNQNAIYLPGKNYNLFYDSITGVNQFRVLINTLFKQNTALVKRFHFVSQRAAVVFNNSFRFSPSRYAKLRTFIKHYR
jgi:hypothetical protein